MNYLQQGGAAAMDQSATLVLPMQELLAKVIGEGLSRSMNQVLLVGASKGVGTSFIAKNWASQLAAANRKVLLVQVVPDDVPRDTDGAAAVALAGQSEIAILRLDQKTCLGLAGIGGATQPTSWQERFGLVIWDVPPLTSSPIALVLARKVDGVILVAQSDKTRRQVAMHTVLRLQESGGTFMGVVLNRTVNYIPRWIYRLL